MTFLYQLFGTILRFIYDLIGNYGWSIVIFSLFAKIITLPLTIKQTRSMQMMQYINPKMTELQKKYANNKEKLNEEMMKLYQQYNYSPLSGCLPLLIQMPILMGLWGALRNPELYVFSSAEFANISQNFLWINNMTYSPLQIFQQNGFTLVFFLSLIIPAVSVALTIWQQKQTTSQGPSQQNMKGMQIFMTVFIAYMGFTFTQGLAIYWTFQTALTVAQNLIMNKFFPPKIIEIKK
ncbi:MAG: YidC/Oxa1 family membrane protein insertase [Anaerofustis sp.]